jgi:hypothetical protein
MASKLLITPWNGSTTAGQDPTIKFQGTGNSTDITLRTASDGSLSIEGTAGQLMSITNSLSGTIYSVNDVSGIPSIEVLDTGLVKLAEYNGSIQIGSATVASNTVNYGYLTIGPTAGVTGAIHRPYTAAATHAAIYNAGVTPGTSNYALLHNATVTILNATTNTYLNVNNSAILTAASTGITIAGTLAASVVDAGVGTITEVARFSRTGAATTATDRGVGIAFSDANNATLVAGVAGIRTGSDGNYNGDLVLYGSSSGGSPTTTLSGLTERFRIIGTGGAAVTGTLSTTDSISATKSVAGVFNGLTLTNTNAGTTADTRITVSNGTNYGLFLTNGTGYTTYGVMTANSSGIYSNAAAGVFIASDNASGSVRIGVGASVPAIAIFTSTGLTIGSGATGSILRTYTAASYAAIYNASLTPDGANHVLAHNGANTLLNGVTSVQLSINSTDKIILSSTATRNMNNLSIEGTTKTAGYFYGGTVDPTNTTRTNYDGNLYATNFIGKASGAGIVGWTPVFSNVTQSYPATFTKATGGNPGWDASVWSSEGYVTNVFVQASPGAATGYVMFGLNSDPATDASFASIDYALYLANGTVQIYEGTLQYTGGTYVATDIFTVQYDGANVRYYQNNTLLWTTARALSTTKLYLDSTFYLIGDFITGLNFGRLPGPTISVAALSSDTFAFAAAYG